MKMTSRGEQQRHKKRQQRYPSAMGNISATEEEEEVDDDDGCTHRHRLGDMLNDTDAAQAAAR